MGGERLWRPDFSDSQPDGQSVTDVWDAKAYATFRVHTIFAECEKKYREFTGGRRFHLVLFSRKHPRVGDLVVLHADAYAELVAAAEVGRGLVNAFQEMPSSAVGETAPRAWEPGGSACME
jgi:hypothetical protein